MANLTRAGFTMVDYDGEKSKVSYAILPATVAILPDILTGVGAIRSAIEGVTLGNIESEYGDLYNTRLSSVRPADVNAQRERKWLVRYYDNVAELGVGVPNPNHLQVDSMEIPTADYDLLLPASDKADPADPAIQALVTALETHARTKFGTTLKVIEIIGVGRNL